jgi:LacI family transcriptional regulator
MKSEDIAKLAGVSRGTVSRVLNGKADVAEATRRKIEKIIEEYGYKPNASARKLAGKPIEIIGFFVYKNRDHQGKKWWLQESPYFVRIMVSLLGAAKKRGYNLLVDIINTEKDFNSIEDYFKSGTVSAGVFMGFDEKVESIENIIKEGYKVSLLDQKKSNNGFDNCILVNADDISGAYKATQYLIDNGHKKIAHVHGNKHILSAKLRIEGYKKALNDNHLVVNKKYIVDGAYDEDISYKSTLKLLKNSNPPSAIFFGNDIMAVGGIKAIREMGLKVKEDISVIGFDNYTFGDSFDMNFSSINAPLEDMSEFAIENLIKSINGEDYQTEYKGLINLVIRDSVKNLKNQ